MLEFAGVTVPVTDIHGSIRFYSRLLDRAPAVVDPAYTVFECSGGQLGLLAVTEPVARAGPQPLLRTNYLDRERARIKPFADGVGEIQEQQGFRLLLLTDPDGNTLEIYED